MVAIRYAFNAYKSTKRTDKVGFYCFTSNVFVRITGFYLVIAKSNIATRMKTESDEHSAINNWLNAFLISGLDKMKILRAFPIKPNTPKIE